MQDYIIIRPTRSVHAKPKPVDYERMKAEYGPLLKRIEAASAAKDTVLTADLAGQAVRLWNECGAWPDNWSAVQRALDDTLHWSQSVELSELASGLVRIVKREGASE